MPFAWSFIEFSSLWIYQSQSSIVGIEQMQACIEQSLGWDITYLFLSESVGLGALGLPLFADLSNASIAVSRFPMLALTCIFRGCCKKPLITNHCAPVLPLRMAGGSPFFPWQFGEFLLVCWRFVRAKYYPWANPVRMHLQSFIHKPPLLIKASQQIECFFSSVNKVKLSVLCVPNPITCKGSDWNNN